MATQVAQKGTPWWGYLLFALLGFAVMALLIYVWTSPSPFGGMPLDQPTKTAAAIVTVLVIIGLVIYFNIRKIIAPEWKPTDYTKQLIKLSAKASKYNMEFPIGHYGDELVGSVDFPIATAAGSQSMFAFQDPGVFNGRKRELIFDDRFDAIRQNNSNPYEGVSEQKILARVRGMEAVFTGKQPEISKTPDVIQREVQAPSQTESPNGLGSGEEVSKMNTEAGQ